MSNIIYVEDSSRDYNHRTEVNASNADATIAFAINFLTSGEICTKNAALHANKLYIPINILYDIDSCLSDVASKLRDCKTLNIAGNGIMTLKKYGVSQDDCDEIVYNFLYKLIHDYGCSFEEIRSGGQTGFDEAGIKASSMLGIRTVCCFPKGWRYRALSGDISNEESFKQRFL